MSTPASERRAAQIRRLHAHAGKLEAVLEVGAGSGAGLREAASTLAQVRAELVALGVSPDAPASPPGPESKSEAAPAKRKKTSSKKARSKSRARTE